MPTDRAHAAPPSRLFVSLVGLTSLAIFLQAVTAGLFVNQNGRDGWVSVHGIVADVTWVLALVTAAVGFRSVRRAFPPLFRGAVALFVLTLAQTGIGHLISDNGVDGLIAVHVPLAIVLFGLTVWLSMAAARAGRATAADPYGTDSAGQDLSLSYRG